MTEDEHRSRELDKRLADIEARIATWRAKTFRALRGDRIAELERERDHWRGEADDWKRVAEIRGPAALHARIREVEDERDEILAQRKDWESWCNEARAERDALQESLRVANVCAEDWEDSCLDRLREVGELTRESDELDGKLDAVQERLLDMEDTCGSLRDAKLAAEAERDALRAEVERLREFVSAVLDIHEAIASNGIGRHEVAARLLSAIDELGDSRD